MRGDDRCPIITTAIADYRNTMAWQAAHPVPDSTAGTGFSAPYEKGIPILYGAGAEIQQRSARTCAVFAMYDPIDNPAGASRITSSAAARARTLCADWREARARRRRRARTASSSLDSACSSFSTSSRPPKMPFHTRDTSPRCLRFCIAGVSCGMGDRGDAAAAAAAEAGASPSAIGGAKTGNGRI